MENKKPEQTLEFRTINAIKELLAKPVDGEGVLKETAHYASKSISSDGRSRTYTDFGGDVCENYNLPGKDGKISAMGILFADAPGNIKDVGVEEAAAYTHALFSRAIFNKMHCLETDVIMYEAHRLLSEQQQEHKEAVPDCIPAVFSIYHTHNGILDITNAGHPAVKIVRPKSKKVISVHGEGLQLGSDSYDLARVPYTKRSIQLEEGDNVVYLSDGLNDGFRTNRDILDRTLLAPLGIPTDFACSSLLYALWNEKADEGIGNDMSISILTVLNQPFRHKDEDIKI